MRSEVQVKLEERCIVQMATPRPRKKSNIGVLEILTDGVETSGLERFYTTVFGRQYYSIMPQVIAAWCRRSGHRVSYATYYGQARPESLLPDDLDVVFVASFSKSSALAYALAKLFRARGVITVLGGPHGRSFPDDAQRYFDIVVVDCDQSSINDIASGKCDVGSIITCGRKAFRIPPLAERYNDIRTASCYFGRSFRLSIVSLLTSTGCPYSCDFCTDWNNPYSLRDTGDLQADLEFAAQRFPGRLIAFHDPNFGVNFDNTLSVLENLSPEKRNPYIVESSLSILKPKRIQRLAATNCVYLAPGIESWEDYGSKAGTSGRTGNEKFSKVVEHFELLGQHLPGLQANFLIGSDADHSEESINLTKEFILRFPNVFPVLNFPIAFGGTPMRESLRQQDRLLPLSPIFYSNPVITHIPKSYDPIALVSHMIDLMELTASRKLFVRRMRASISHTTRIVFSLLTLKLTSYLPELREFSTLLKADRTFLNFHEGRESSIPEYYHWRLDRRLGRLAPLIPRSERQTVLC